VPSETSTSAAQYSIARPAVSAGANTPNLSLKRTEGPLLDPQSAWNLLAAHVGTLGTEGVHRRAATGKVLAKPLTASVDVPASDVSAMDGFATAAVENGEALQITGVVAAGDPPGAHLDAGTAMRIMTGAPVPSGADRVTPVEQTSTEGAVVRIQTAPIEGAHIRRQGEVVRSGQEILHAGAQLTPGALSLLATHGAEQVVVYRPPRVGVLVTGDEVVDPSEEPGPGQLRDSHTDFLFAAGKSIGLEFDSLGVVGDDIDSLRARIARGLGYDVLLLTGGVSMGEFDFVEDVLADLRCELIFDSVAVQPGKPLVAARHSGGLVFGLPGNPTSAMAGFWLFVRPTLRRMLGSEDGYWHGALDAVLAAPAGGAKARDRFVPVSVRFNSGRLEATPLEPMGSHDGSASAHGSALLRIPAHSEPLESGALCQILPLADWRGENLAPSA